MTRSTWRTLCSVILLPAAAAAQRSVPNATVVYAVGAEPMLPVPLFTRDREENVDLSDQLFLHLVTFAPNAQGVGDNMFAPALARSWKRIDPVTLTFELDPRAKWQDGAPVTARDVVFTWELINNPKVDLDHAVYREIASVEATGDRTVRVRFRHPSAEQLYTFGFLVQPLPSHLLEKIAPEAIPNSDFMRRPIGDGPYRFDHRTAGLAVELHADSTFFLGRPSINRVLFRTAADPTARVNLFLTGETDVLDKIPPASLPQVQQHAGGRIINVASNALPYLLFNPRAPADSARPHPILGDARVREALTLALDRATIATATFGAGTLVPDAAQSQLWGWITGGTVRGSGPDLARARTLLAQAGWRSAGSDGILVRDGVPLHFSVTFAGSSAAGASVAQMAQAMWRKVGVDAQLDRIDGSVMGNRLKSGQWDMVYLRANQDPTPSSLVQSWSCESARQPGSTNNAHWCDTTFDRLVGTAMTAHDQPGAWRAVLARMTAARPAIFIAAPANQIAVHARYDNVILWPSHTWLSLWQWRVKPAAALPRDR